MLKKSFIITGLAACLLMGCGNEDSQLAPSNDIPETPSVDKDTPDNEDNENTEGNLTENENQNEDDSPSNNTDDENTEDDDPPVPEKIACTHDICNIDYQDILDGNAEALGTEYTPCIDGFLGDVQTCPQGKICIDGGCMDSFVIGDKEACKIEPDYEYSLAYENDYGSCTPNGNYSVTCRYGKIAVRSCKRPCEMTRYGYARCPQTEEGSQKEYFDRYYCDAYEKLTEDEKEIYQQIFDLMLDAIKNEKSGYDFEDINREMLDNASRATHICIKDLPLQPNCGGSYGSYKNDSPNYAKYHIGFCRKPREPEKDQKEQELQNTVFEILEPTDAMNTALEKELHVHNWMTRNILYKKGEGDQSIYNALVKHECVCGGYANSFKYLMDRLLIPAWYVSGTGNSERHAWNIVQIDGEYYNVDVTWDRFENCNILGYQMEPCIRYTYFNRTDEFFKTKHTPNEGLILPECTSLSASFEAILGIDAIAKVIKTIYPFFGENIVTSMDEYYADIKAKLIQEISQHTEFNDSSYKFEQISMVIGKDLISDIPKLKNDDRNNAYLNEIMPMIPNYKCLSVITNSSTQFLGDDTSAFIKTTHLFVKSK